MSDPSALLKHFSPVLLLENGTKLTPARAERVLPAAELQLMAPGALSAAERVVLPIGEVTVEKLVSTGCQYPQHRLRLHVSKEDWQEPMGAAEQNPPVYVSCKRLPAGKGQAVAYEMTYVVLYVVEQSHKLFSLWDAGPRTLEWLHLTVRVSAGGVMEGVYYNRCSEGDNEWLPSNRVPKIDGKILVFVPEVARSRRHVSSRKKSPLALLKDKSREGRVWNPSAMINMGAIHSTPSGGSYFRGKHMPILEFDETERNRTTSSIQDLNYSMDCLCCFTANRSQGSKLLRQLKRPSISEISRLMWNSCFQKESNMQE